MELVVCRRHAICGPFCGKPYRMFRPDIRSEDGSAEDNGEISDKDRYDTSIFGETQLQQTAGNFIRAGCRVSCRIPYPIPQGTSEELFLSDGKTRYRLEFDCDRYVMKIITP